MSKKLNFKNLIIIVITFCLLIGLNYVSINFFPNFKESLSYLVIVSILCLVIFVLAIKNILDITIKIKNK